VRGEEGGEELEDLEELEDWGDGKTGVAEMSSCPSSSFLTPSLPIFSRSCVLAFFFTFLSS
jgi:hypothetical protein